jgi:hypothetical protein
MGDSMSTDKKTTPDVPRGPRKCGLIMPISAIDGYSSSHWEDVKSIIVEALHDTGFEVELVSELEGNGLIHNRIVTNLFFNDIVICDVSAKNPNVMFELGMRLAFDKPVVIIKDDKTSYSFDATPIEHLSYPSDLNYPLIQAFKTRLRETAVATHEKSRVAGYQSFMKNFGQIVVTGLESREVSKEQYLVNAIAELQGGMKNLTNLMSQEVVSRRTPLWRPELSPGTSGVSKEHKILADLYEKYRGLAGNQALSAVETDGLTNQLLDEWLSRSARRNEMSKQDVQDSRDFVREFVSQLERNRSTAKAIGGFRIAQQPS